MNYSQAYENGKEKLKNSEIEEAALDARLLLEFLMNTDRNALLVHGDRELSDDEYQSYVNLIDKRASHIPLQYITGVQEFMGLKFYVNQDTLIPRQDTETLVEEALRFLHDGMSILDMCTGTGCILISLLHYSNDCYGVGSDQSVKAIEIAKKNALLNEVVAEWKVGDLFDKVEGRYDMILSNPPYIESKEILSLAPEVREHEPETALDGGMDGLNFYRRIIAEAPAYLNREGMLFFEIGYNQAEAVMRMMRENGFEQIRKVCDLCGMDRVVYGTKVQQ